MAEVKQLKKKIKALSAAFDVIKANKLTENERTAIRRALAVFYDQTDWKDHFDKDAYMRMLNEGWVGWEKSSDVELAAEADALGVFE